MKKIKEFWKNIPDKHKQTIKFLGKTFLSFFIIMLYSSLIGAVCYALMGWNAQRITIVITIMTYFFPYSAVKHFNTPKWLKK